MGNAAANITDRNAEVQNITQTVQGDPDLYEISLQGERKNSNFKFILMI